MSEGLITFWRSFIPLWRSIQPINILTIAGQKSCFDRIHSKVGICLWFPPGAALCAYPCSDSSGSSHCELGNHRQALGGAKRSPPAVSWAAAAGQQCCHRGGCLGSTQVDRRGNRQGNAASPAWAARSMLPCKGGVDSSTATLPVPQEQLWSSSSPARSRWLPKFAAPEQPVLVLLGHHGSRNCGGNLGCPPYPSTCCFSKTYQVLQKVSATLHFSLRGQETERDFRGACLSRCFTTSCRNVLHSLVHVRELWGWVGTRLHCQMVTEMRVYTKI